MKMWICLLLSLVVALPLAGCAKGRTQVQARGICLTWGMLGSGDGQDKSCQDRNEICNAFLYGAEMESLSRAECMRHCADTEAELLRGHVVDGCGELIRTGRRQCELYCFSKPESP